MKPTDLVVTPAGLRFIGQTFPCTIGSGGITDRKQEGDGATPRGVHGIVGMLYRPDRMAPPAAWAVPIRPFDAWSDDPSDPEYNLMCRLPRETRHECLRRPDPLYDLILVTDWNWPFAVRGRGSAIFVHRWRRPRHTTAGCVGLPPNALRWIAPRIRIGTRLIVH